MDAFLRLPPPPPVDETDAVQLAGETKRPQSTDLDLPYHTLVRTPCSPMYMEKFMCSKFLHIDGYM